MEEGKKQLGSASSSSSSFTSDLFGAKEPSVPSSSGIFGSIFSPPSKVLGRESLFSEALDKKQDSSSQAWTPKPGPQDTISGSSEGKNVSVPNTNRESSPFYEEQRGQQPCHLSSSLYYGGQDIYSPPQNTEGSLNSTVNKDGGEDDSGKASRGNWWQGSLYY